MRRSSKNKDKINHDSLIRAAKAAQINAFIERELPEGFDTFVGERGVRLSGGQRQRIGLARALYHQPDVLILDEATSALDIATEAEVMKAIDTLQGSLTLIIIAHRLSTIQHADEILVIQQGEIIERGTHQELLKIEGGLYQKLSLMQ